MAGPFLWTGISCERHGLPGSIADCSSSRREWEEVDGTGFTPETGSRLPADSGSFGAHDAEVCRRGAQTVRPGPVDHIRTKILKRHPMLPLPRPCARHTSYSLALAAAARQRLAFDELLSLQLGLQQTAGSGNTASRVTRWLSVLRFSTLPESPALQPHRGTTAGY
jgi:hypothetical protein